MAIRINANGTRAQVAPARGPAFTLEELQGVVGGYIEAFYLFDGRIMFINEDGKRFALAANLLATQIARANGLPPDDYIVGDAIVMTRAEAGGGDEDLEEPIDIRRAALEIRDATAAEQRDAIVAVARRMIRENSNATHDCSEWVKDGRCELCDREVRP